MLIGYSAHCVDIVIHAVTCPSNIATIQRALHTDESHPLRRLMQHLLMSCAEPRLNSLTAPTIQLYRYRRLHCDAHAAAKIVRLSRFDYEDKSLSHNASDFKERLFERRSRK
jgi:hypothetical protein